MRISRELHIAAPEPHVAVYAQSPTYTALDGFTLIEAVKEEVRTRSGRYYDRRIYRRRSADNGVTWGAEEPLHCLSDNDIETGCRVRMVPMHYLEPDTGLLVSLYATSQRAGSDTGFNGAGDMTSRTGRLHYEISRDGAHTWEPHGPVIAVGDEYDDVHWGPGLHYGKNGATADLAPWVSLGEGAFACGISRQPLDKAGDIYSPYGGYFLEVVCLRGRWTEDLSDIEWEMGRPISVGPDLSTVGCCEPAMCSLGEGRLWGTMRCQGSPERDLPSLKFTSLSEDGGLTWSEPEPLRYDDGEVVSSPASLAQLHRPSYSDKLYWIGNVHHEPVCGQTPRYPLYIAQVDPYRLCLLRDTLRVIDDRAEGQPEDVRFTNWGSYEDRVTGELVLTLPIEPKTNWDELTSDCYRYRIAFS